MGARRLINPQTMMLGQEPRQTTSNLGYLNKPSIQVSAPWLTWLLAHVSLSVISTTARTLLDTAACDMFVLLLKRALTGPLHVLLRPVFILALFLLFSVAE